MLSDKQIEVMIKVNGKVIEQNRFPDGTLALKGDFEKNVGYEFDCGEVSELNNWIEWLYDSDSEMFTIMCIVDILRRNGCKKISLCIPYTPHARMDRIKSQNENFSLKVFADWLNSLKFDSVHVLNVHSNVSEALINNVVSELPEFDIRKTCEMYKPDVIFFPDEGACKRYSDMTVIKELNLPIAFGIKKRDWQSGTILGLDIVGGELVKYKRVLIVDDMSSFGGTFKFSAIKLKELGATDVGLYVSHCENSIQKGELLKTDLISKIYTTDSILTISDPKIEIIRKFRY